jgi:hypothetical protein
VITPIAPAPATPAPAATPGPSSSVRPATGGPLAVAQAGALSLQLEGVNSIQVGEETTVSLTLNADQPLVSTAFQIAYDPKAVRLLDVSEGDLLREDGTKTTFSARKDENAGMVFVGVSRPAGGAGSTGHGTLVQLRMQGLAPSQAAPVRVTGFSAIGPGNRIVPAPAAAALDLAVTGP